MTSQPAIRVAAVRKTYGPTVALDDVSFEVQPGEIFGLIGPNGAGKTTTLECVEGLRAPDRGEISVLGLHPIRHRYALQDRIGVQAPGGAAPEAHHRAGGRPLLGVPVYPRPVDGTELIDRLGLTEKRDAWFMTLSGGQKQRLFIALSLINDPELVFLDELTTGLDPQARRAIWDLVRAVRQQGKTIVLTTHLMEEAERLCDRVAIVDHGRVVDVGAPAALVRRHCPERTVVVETGEPAAADRFRRIPQVESVTGDGRQVTIRGRGEDLVTEVIGCLAEHRIRVADLRTEQPTLEDVFLKLTGHALRD
jgi:ABC-2 type transport system ATP-binding protein